MKWSFLLIPLIGAGTGWMIVRMTVKMLFWPENPVKLPFNVSWQGVLPRKQAELAAGVRAIVETQLLTAVTAEAGVAPEILGSLVNSVAEATGEHVYRKVPAIVPRAVRNKIAGAVADILRREIPRVVNTLAENLRDSGSTGADMCRYVEEAVRGYDLRELERRMSGSREVFLLKTAAAAGGFLSGLVQLLVVWLDAA